MSQGITFSNPLIVDGKVTTVAAYRGVQFVGEAEISDTKDLIQHFDAYTEDDGSEVPARDFTSKEWKDDEAMSEKFYQQAVANGLVK